MKIEQPLSKLDIMIIIDSDLILKTILDNNGNDLLMDRKYVNNAINNNKVDITNGSGKVLVSDFLVKNASSYGAFSAWVEESVYSVFEEDVVSFDKIDNIKNHITTQGGTRKWILNLTGYSEGGVPDRDLNDK